MVIITGVQAMLTVATDAQLEGSAAGIDARNLVDALDTTRRLAFALGNLSTAERPERDDFDNAVRRRLESWLANLRAQLEPGHLKIAPLRTMVAAAMTPALIAVDDPAREHIARLILTLDAQLRMISLSPGGAAL